MSLFILWHRPMRGRGPQMQSVRSVIGTCGTSDVGARLVQRRKNQGIASRRKLKQLRFQCLC